MKSVIPYIKFFINLFCGIFMFLIPNMLVPSITEAGYSGDMFSSIFIVKTFVYVLVLMVIMFSFHQLLSYLEKK